MELSGSGYLYTLAILCITFATMSAIVVVLRHTTGAPFSSFELHLTKLYVEEAFLVAGLSMLPVLLSLLAIPHPLVWQVVSVIGAAALGVHGYAMARRRRAVTRDRLPTSVWIMLTIRALLVLALLANAMAIPIEINAGVYSAIVSYFLGHACFLFSVRLNAFLAGAV